MPERVRRVRGSVARAGAHGLIRAFGRPVLVLQMLFLSFSLLAIWHCWALILDGRYRDFPIGNYWLPAVLLLAWKLATLLRPSPHAPSAHRLAEALSFGRLYGLVGSEPTAGMAPATPLPASQAPQATQRSPRPNETIRGGLTWAAISNLIGALPGRI